jgi:hypothetical protein
LIEFLLSELITDDSADHEAMLSNMFAQLPQDFAYLSAQYGWAVQRGFLWKGIRAVIWDRVEQGRSYFKRAAELKAVVDESLMQHTTYHLLGFEHERGSDATLKVLSDLRPFLNQLTYLVNRAFENYRMGEYKRVPGKVIQAWRRDSSYLTNRGVLSIFLRSLVKGLR